MAAIFGQKNCWCTFRMMMTFTEVKGHQRSNVINYATFLNIVILYCLLMRRDVWFANHLVLHIALQKGNQLREWGKIVRTYVRTASCKPSIEVGKLFHRAGAYDCMALAQEVSHKVLLWQVTFMMAWKTPGGYSNYFLTGCAARGLKPLPISKDFSPSKNGWFACFSKFSQIETHF